MRRIIATIFLLLSTPALAAVKSDTAAGFEIVLNQRVAADPAAVYAILAKPALWWNGAHSWSGDAANLSLEPRAGGCFCEALPDGGSVEHGHVIMARPGKLLRLAAALGPLQSEAVTAILTWELKPAEGATDVTLTYVVSGYIRAARTVLPAGVDGMLAEQLTRLKQRIEAR